MNKQKLYIKISQAVTDFDYDGERILTGEFDTKLMTIISLMTDLVFERYCNLVRMEHGREYEETYRNSNS